MFTKTKIISTNLTSEQVIRIIASKEHSSMDIIPSEIITGNLGVNRMDGIIKMPKPMVDPFFNQIKILAIPNKYFSDVRIQVKIGVLNLCIIMAWPILLIVMCINVPTQEFKEYILLFLVIGGFMFVTYLLFRLKLVWDFKRVNKWLKDECKIRSISK